MQVTGNRVAVEGALTLDSAAAFLNEGSQALALVWRDADQAVVDLGGLGTVDSSALAVVFAWVRQARLAGKQVGLANSPKDLLSLASVYGVSDLLPLA